MCICESALLVMLSCRTIVDMRVEDSLTNSGAVNDDASATKIKLWMDSAESSPWRFSSGFDLNPLAAVADVALRAGSADRVIGSFHQPDWHGSRLSFVTGRLVPNSDHAYLISSKWDTPFQAYVEASKTDPEQALWQMKTLRKTETNPDFTALYYF
jgi:hypothetical protein